VAIKILLISNVEGGSDELTDSLDIEGVTIISKEVSADAKSLAKHAAALFAQGRYDLIVAIVDNPISANIALNKYEGITASVCDDSEEAKDAKDNGVNALVVKASASGSVGGMIATYTKGKLMSLPKIRMPAVTLPARPQPQERESVVQQVAPKQQVQVQPVMQKKVKPVAQQQKADYSDDVQLPSRPGIKGWFEDALGIVDSDKPKAANKGKKETATK
jgi:ribose 5-phosphate isomerase RpiB